jgi:hypothetical protein
MNRCASDVNAAVARGFLHAAQAQAVSEAVREQWLDVYRKLGSVGSGSGAFCYRCRGLSSHPLSGTDFG